MKGLTEVHAAAIPSDIEIAGIGADSRTMAPGFLFAALPGAKADGRTFIGDALARGAVAVRGPAEGNPLPPEAGAVLLRAANPRRAYALLAARFFARQPASVAAVTGTNGKTSTVHFLRQIWTELGLRAASIGTLGVVGSGGEGRQNKDSGAGDAAGVSGLGAGAPGGETLRAGGLTTPDPAELHRALKNLAESGVENLALEASSHGLDQYRLDGVRLKAAAFTNLTRDHLDYHRDMAAYLAAKRRLFAELLPADAVAVVHAGAPGADAILDACRKRGVKLITYGGEDADVALRSGQPTPGGQRLDLSLFGIGRMIEFPLVGGLEVENGLAALALAL
ncbi:MAG: Mur ligase family protein, partial [Pseudomonadota bacterium]